MNWEKFLIYICALLISLGFASFAIGHLLSVACPLLNQ